MNNNIGNLILRIGLGLLFIWGGLEKLFIGYFGGVGLEKMAKSLKHIFVILNQEGSYILALWLAISELIAGILIFTNIKTFYAALYAAFVLIVALVSIYLPRGNWMQSMIHIALITSYIGLGFNYRK